MKVITGHLTEANKKAIRAILSMNLNCGRSARITYLLKKEEGVYTVIIVQNDRGLIPVPGTELRETKRRAQFTL